MTKNTLIKLIRMLLIFSLLFGSYYVYKTYTYFAIQRFDFDIVRINSIIHYFIFFLIGVTIKFDIKLIPSLKNHSLKVNVLNLSITTVLLIILLFLKYRAFMYISFFIAFLIGFFFIDSFESE